MGDTNEDQAGQPNHAPGYRGKRFAPSPLQALLYVNQSALSLAFLITYLVVAFQTHQPQ
jgi:hypothetical protein